MNTDYLTDADRERLAGQARTYALAHGWHPEHVAAFPQYFVNRNESYRTAIDIGAASFRIVKNF